VAVMHDVRSEASFKNFRNWVQSMRECALEDCVLMLVGNNIDLCESGGDESRVVKKKDGEWVAREAGGQCLFFEGSSRRGVNVVEARLLTEREDKQIEDVLNLNGKVEAKKGCCNWKCLVMGYLLVERACDCCQEIKRVFETHLFPK
jgi:GTPase SAR1 family protein